MKLFLLILFFISPGIYASPITECEDRNIQVKLEMDYVVVEEFSYQYKKGVFYKGNGDALANNVNIRKEFRVVNEIPYINGRPLEKSLKLYLNGKLQLSITMEDGIMNNPDTGKEFIAHMSSEVLWIQASFSPKNDCRLKGIMEFMLPYAGKNMDRSEIVF